MGVRSTLLLLQGVLVLQYEVLVLLLFPTLVIKLLQTLLAKLKGQHPAGHVGPLQASDGDHPDWDRDCQF